MEINITPVQMHCPNCGKIITGFKGDDGTLRIKCDRCKVVIFSKYHSKGDVNIKMSFPK